MSLDETEAELRRYALAFPGAWEDHPWGESVAKVGKKVFLFLGKPAEGELGLSVKLPRSALDALELPFTAPTGYGLGKAGWVSCRFVEGDAVPLDQLRAWIAESYRAIAPKRLIKELDGG